MPYQHHPTRPLTPESAIDKWAEKPTVKQAAISGFVIFGILIIRYLLTGA